MPRISHVPITAGRSGSASSSSETATSAACASSFSAVARPPRVGSRIQRTAPPSESSASASSCTGAVSLSRSTSSSSSPRATITAIPWSPSVPETSTRSPGPHALGAELDPGRDEADPGRRHVEPVGLPALDHLRVAGRHGNGHRRRGPRHRGGDAAQVGDREALLDHEAGRERDRPRSRDGEVVDGAVDGEVADVAAGEEDRLDDVRVGRERDARAVQVEQRRVGQRREQRVVELLEEQALDEGPRRLSARAVGERDELVAKLRPPRPHAVTRSRRFASRP